jgi:hypothetical protein
MELPPFLVTAAPYLAVGLFVFIFTFVIYALFTKKGRTIGPEVIFGCKVIENLGEIANNPILLGRQKLTLLGCEKDGEKFLVIEIRNATVASLDVTWIKIDDQALNAINRMVK